MPTDNDELYSPGTMVCRLKHTNGNEEVNQTLNIGGVAVKQRYPSLGPKPKGWKPPKPYSAKFVNVSGPKGGRTYRFKRRSVDYGATCYGVAEMPRTWEQNPYGLTDDSIGNAAAIDALISLKDVKLDAGAALAEIDETAKLIAGTGTTILRSYQAMRRGNYRQAGRLLGIKKPTPRDLAGKWLWYNWGVAPLMSDADAAVKALVANSLDAHWTPFLYGKGTNSTALEQTRVTLGGPYDTTDYVTLLLGGMRHAKVGLYAKPETGFFQLTSSLGLNPLAMAWERTFLSAVVDWFLPVGDYFQALDAVAGLQFLGGYKTYFLEVDGKYFGDSMPDGTRIKDFRSTYTGTYKERQVQRFVLRDFPNANPSYFKNPFSGMSGVKRAITASSLLIGFMSKNPPPTFRGGR